MSIPTPGHPLLVSSTGWILAFAIKDAKDARETVTFSIIITTIII
jgi:hypothetical protein